MYGVEEIFVPDISDYFEVTIAAEEVITAKPSRIVPVSTDSHILFVTNPDRWWVIRTGEYPKKFSTLIDEYAIYESEDGVLVPVSKIARRVVIGDSIIDRAANLIDSFGFLNPLILFTDKGTTCVIEPAKLRYLCFKLIPRSKKIRVVENVEIEHFWEIISIALTSDRRTVFEIKMKV